MGRDETGKWDVPTFRTLREFRLFFLFEESFSFAVSQRSLITLMTCHDVELRLPNFSLFLRARLCLRTSIPNGPIDGLLLRVGANVWM